MTVVQQIVSIAIAAVANFFTRYIPFLIFGRQKTGKEELSPFIEGLGNFLPPAIMGMLVVYCFRNVHFLSGDFGLPEIIASIITILVHLRKRSMCLSLLVGTISYNCVGEFCFLDKEE
ncbi:MAG: AzlD domain-containing protein [Limosilactobacillus sp.]|jgi:branched-subunit amino acid transport protein AzlD|uniref:branched-chain amino acid transporter permease n=1 Tax=Limosilactobacillus sp. TaxID=2773925 RepID=UPI0025BA9D02|nr:AzlD domain-containing protein [Limosilactobacillus sp.]MCI1975150.1 AzlD domain-containing protein [Limosilactobacillus sp.]MCI2031750.1 AzlD domain-containing protein [Limosilactobacillus sp.]